MWTLCVLRIISLHLLFIPSSFHSIIHSCSVVRFDSTLFFRPFNALSNVFSAEIIVYVCMRIGFANSAIRSLIWSDYLDRLKLAHSFLRAHTHIFRGHSGQKICLLSLFCLALGLSFFFSFSFFRFYFIHFKESFSFIYSHAFSAKD